MKFLQVQSARQTLFWLDLVVDGKPACVDTKFSMLQAGVAQLLDPEDEPEYWPNATSAAAVTDPEAVDPKTFTFQGGTDDPVIVVLARRYFDAKNSDTFQEGNLPIPSRAEAELELRQAWQPQLAAA